MSFENNNNKCNTDNNCKLQMQSMSPKHILANGGEKKIESWQA